MERGWLEKIKEKCNEKSVHFSSQQTNLVDFMKENVQVFDILIETSPENIKTDLMKSVKEAAKGIFF